MLKEIIVENFRSYKEGSVKLSKGITAILGNPQSGKTNIFRGVELVRTNRPLGNRFIPRYEEDEVIPIVTIVTDEDRVTIEKKKSKTTYNLNGKEFSSGRKIPDQITEALNLGDINIHAQTDKPFIITDTPGEVIKVINKITKLEKVDEWRRKLNARIAKKNTEIDIYKNEQEEDGKKLEKLEKADELELLVRKVDVLQKKINKLKSNEEQIRNLLNTHKNINGEIGKIKKKLTVEQYLEDILKTDEEFEELCNLEDLIIDYLNYKEATKEIKQSFNSLQKVLTDTLNLNAQIDVLRGLKISLGVYIDTKEGIDRIKASIVVAKEKYRNKLKELKICPTCNTKLTKGVIDEIFSNF